jgi:hypothetical protein
MGIVKMWLFVAFRWLGSLHWVALAAVLLAAMALASGRFRPVRTFSLFALLFATFVAAAKLAYLTVVALDPALFEHVLFHGPLTLGSETYAQVQRDLVPALVKELAVVCVAVAIGFGTFVSARRRVTAAPSEPSTRNAPDG